jgi:hypothetical protein
VLEEQQRTESEMKDREHVNVPLALVNDGYKGKPKQSGEILLKFHIIHHEYHKKSPGTGSESTE